MYRDIEEEVLDHEFEDEVYDEETCLRYVTYSQTQSCIACTEPGCISYEGARVWGDTSPSSVEPPSLPRFSDGRPGGLVG
jgi:hypothetical protein